MVSFIMFHSDTARCTKMISGSVAGAELVQDTAEEVTYRRAAARCTKQLTNTLLQAGHRHLPQLPRHVPAAGEGQAGA